MSKYDKERQSLGMVQSSGQSKYATERETYRAQMTPLPPEQQAYNNARGNSEADEAYQMAHQFDSTQDHAYKPQGKVEKVLDKIFNDNPVMRVVGYIPQKIAEIGTSAPYLDGRTDELGYHSLGERTAALNPADTGNATLNKAGDALAHVGALFTPMGTPGGTLVNDAATISSKLTSTGIGRKLTDAASKLGAGAVNKSNQVLNTQGINLSTKIGSDIGERLVKGTTTGAIYGAMAPFANGTGDLSEVPKSVLENAAGFALGDAALGAAGSGLGAIGKRYAGTKLGDAINRFFGEQAAPQPKQEILGLPAAGETYGSTFKPKQPLQTDDVIYAPGQVYEPPVLGLPEPNLQPATTARVETKTNPYRQKFEQLMQDAQQMQFTPGKELEELQSLWSQRAGREDPSLDELIDLAYPKPSNRRQVDVDTLSKAREQQRQREVYGVPSPVKSTADRYQPFVGEAAEPRMRLQRAAEQLKPENQISDVDVFGTKELSKNAQADALSQGQLTTIKLQDGRSIHDLNKDELRQVYQMLSDKKERLRTSGTDVNRSDYQLMVEAIDNDMQTVKSLLRSEKPQAATSAASGDPYNSFDPTEFKDISGFSAQTRDIYRNLEAVLGKENARMFLEPFNDAKNEYVDMQKYWIDELKKNVVDKLGIQKGSKLSALVQKYGEKQITLDELMQQAPNDWEKVVEADKWFRKAYDHLIDIVNDSRAKIYPNNPDKIVPKRADYYRHFQDLNGLAGLKNLFDTPSAIDPSLARISEFTKPRSKFAGFMQRRGLGPFKNDAVGGFLEYIPSASYSTHIDPQIEVWRGLSKVLAENTSESRNLNNLVLYLERFANDLSGKTNIADRFIQDTIPGGRKTMAALQWLNNRVKANTILGNIGSVVSQTANIPNGISFAKQYAVKGFGDTMLSALGKELTPIADSPFIKERFSGAMYRQFDTKWFQQPRRFAEWMMETADRLGTTFVWNSAYRKGLAENVADPIRYADDNTRKLIAGRGVGEVPLLQKAKVTQFLAPFQLEVANLWRVMGDFVREKDFGALATLFVANYLFNRAAEKIKGSPVTFDPIQAIIEAAQDGLTPAQRAGRVGGEILSALPLGQTIAQLYPEYGTNTLPTRDELFGNNDPTRFGGGVLAVKGMQDPLYKLALPFGGNQLKKSIQGIEAMNKGGAYTDKGELKYPIEDNALNNLRLPLFGASSVPEARDYYDNNLRPLSAKQTQQYEQSQNKQGVYESITKQREVNKLKDAILKLQKDEDMKPEERAKKLREAVEKLKSVAGK